MKKIYRTYNDTEVSVLATQLECPYCGVEWLEDNMNDCGKTYEIECSEDWNDGCGEKFLMHFDAS